MNEHDGVDSQSPLHPHRPRAEDSETMLETRIANVFQKQAAQVHYTPAQRERMMHHVFPRSQHNLFAAPTRVSIAALVVIISMVVFLFATIVPRLAITSTLHYAVSTSLSTPAALANGGHLVSLDPTQHHFVYQAAQEPGVMYTADISDPASSNLLAMRYARDVAWAPDGSALVTTIAPAGVIEPLLALVHTGQYMDTLGHAALAASWSPTSKQQIVYVTQENGITNLWDTTPLKGQTPHLIAILPIASRVLRLVSSPDGRELALITTTEHAPSSQLLEQTGDAIYIMDSGTHQVHALPLAEHIAIGNVVFSPNGHYLTYEQSAAHAPTLLHTIDLVKQQEAFTIAPQHSLLGWSWSSDSNVLAYSDGGVLTAHVLHGPRITFPATSTTYPLWLADGRILALSITNGVGKLEILAHSTTA